MGSEALASVGTPSRTAMIAACARGWHLHSYGDRAVFADWLAWGLAGSSAEQLLAGLRAAFGDISGHLATWVAARSRVTEDWLAASEAEQYVILGAGLDSYAWRQDRRVRVFEIDQPGTQSWKQARIEALSLAVPDELVWTSIDLENEPLDSALERAGLRSAPTSTFVSWLGVIPYLSPEAIAATLQALPPCTLAATYTLPEELWDPAVIAAAHSILEMARQAGEPVLTWLTSEEFEALLAGNGFTVVEDVGPEDVERRYGIAALSILSERVALATKG